VDTTSLCVVSPAGAVIAELTIENEEDGFAEAIGWMLRSAPSRRLLVGLEGTRSYGAGLCRALQRVGITVVEVERPSRGERGRRGKSDTGDAVLAARKLLAMDLDRAPQPRSGDGDREALRLLTIAREELNRHRTGTINQLLAVLLTGDAADQQLRKRDLTVATVRQLTRRRGPGIEDRQGRTRRLELRRLAEDLLRLNQQLRDNDEQLKEILEDIAPQLLKPVGVGPVVAAQLIVSYSHHGRCRNEGAFAALGGACPIEASSGRITRHRLNRGGDRRLNRALYTIALTRAKHDPDTRAFIERHSRTKTNREIRRILKRYIARQMFKILQTIDALNPTTTAGLAQAG
jgi:transposase